MGRGRPLLGTVHPRLYMGAEEVKQTRKVVFAIAFGVLIYMVLVPRRDLRGRNQCAQDTLAVVFSAPRFYSDTTYDTIRCGGDTLMLHYDSISLTYDTILRARPH